MNAIDRTAGAPAPKPFAFGKAIKILKRGGRVAREGWNGKGMWLQMKRGAMPGAKFRAQSSSGLSDGIPLALFDDAFAGPANLPSIQMRTASGAILTGWLASQTDMLAEDWHVVPQPIEINRDPIPCWKSSVVLPSDNLLPLNEEQQAFADKAVATAAARENLGTDASQQAAMSFTCVGAQGEGPLKPGDTVFLRPKAWETVSWPHGECSANAGWEDKASPTRELSDEEVQATFLREALDQLLEFDDIEDMNRHSFTGRMIDLMPYGEADLPAAVIERCHALYDLLVTGEA